MYMSDHYAAIHAFILLARFNRRRRKQKKKLRSKLRRNAIKLSATFRCFCFIHSVGTCIESVFNVFVTYIVSVVAIQKQTLLWKCERKKMNRMKFFYRCWRSYSMNTPVQNVYQFQMSNIT